MKSKILDQCFQNLNKLQQSAQQNFLEIITGKKETYKTQKIITKCLKQFDLRLFEEIRESIQENTKTKGKTKNKIKKALKSAFASRAKISNILYGS